jgi:hypothetical protein
MEKGRKRMMKLRIIDIGPAAKAEFDQDLTGIPMKLVCGAQYFTGCLCAFLHEIGVK